MKKLNQATKYTIIICVGLLIFNIIFGYVLVTTSAKALREQINARMLDISNTAASMINGDEMAKLTKDDLGSPEYQRIMDTLTYFQDSIELEYIYCIMQVSEREFVFGVDPTIEDPGEFGSPIVYTDALYEASKGKAGVDDKPYADEWGTFYSSYTPVFDSEGNVAGIVAADFSSDWYQDQIKHQALIVMSFMGLALICSIAMAILIARQYNKFFMTLIKRMNDLSQGIETLINEVAQENGEDEGQSFAPIEGDTHMGDAMTLLGEKIFVMQERLARQIEVIRSHAYIDRLTGLNNRNSYEEYQTILEKKMAEKPDLVYSVVVFDINQLKMINDDYGHDKGDKLIIEISKDIREVFGRDRIYRVGGDEFVSILDDPDPSNKMKRVKEIIAAKNVLSPIFNDPSIEIGLSIGYAAYDSATDTTYQQVFRRADNAMYADKREFYKTHEDRRKRRG